MKTTIDIADTLFAQTRRTAMQRGRTFKEMVEAALRLFLKGAEAPPRRFRLRRRPFRGRGVVPGLSEGDWGEIRRRIYEGRGG